MPNLSVVIPSWKDPYLHKTIDSLLENAETDIEIIPVLDGYWPEKPIIDNKHVRVLHLGKNRGMRRAINMGVRIASAEYIMRTDEHCSFSKGFDRVILETIEDNWIVTPRRYALDPVKWEIIKEIPPVDFMKLKIQNVSNKIRKFAGVESPGDPKQKIQESMAMQGSCWIMKKTWWDKIIGELENDGYGPHYQDSHEMVFKTWQAGGKLMVNKNAWHAHKHRKFPRTHNNGTKENPSNNEQCWAYSLKVWEDYYEKEVRPKWNI